MAQAQICAGLDAINKAFDGTTRSVNRATAYAPGRTYHNADGSVAGPTTGMQTTQTGGMEVRRDRRRTVFVAAADDDHDRIASAAEQFGGRESLHRNGKRPAGSATEHFANIAKMHRTTTTRLINEQYRAAQRTCRPSSATANSEYQRAAGEPERDYQRQLDESSQAEFSAGSR